MFADSATDLLDEPHIRPFAALLRVIDNPAQDIPLAAVLLSPMFPYTADDLVALRRAPAHRQFVRRGCSTASRSG